MPCDSIHAQQNKRSGKKTTNVPTQARLRDPRTNTCSMAAETGSPKRAGGHANTYLGIIWAVESLGEVCGLRKGHAADAANEASSDDALLAAKNADLETRVLRSFEDLMAVQAVKGLRRVLARNGAVDEDRPPAGMQVGEAG